MKNFTPIPDPTGNIDAIVSTRILFGRMTPKRFEILNRYCRKNTWCERGGSEYDCTGRKFAQDVELDATHWSATITVTEHFDC